jgi:disulfide bond formation protein DsbB
MLNQRLLNFLGFLGCAGLMGYALFAQFVLDLPPCPLCIFQRVAVVAVGVLFLLAAIHNPGRAGSAVYAILLGLSAGAGVAVAWRHIWLQGLPADQVPACGPGLDFMLDQFPVWEVLTTVLTGSGKCAEISWSFLGLSMPAWVLISVAVLGGYALYVNLRLPALARA